MSEHDSDYIQWKNTMQYNNLPREDIIGIVINAYIKDNNNRLWNLTKPTDTEVVNWMVTNRVLLDTIPAGKLSLFISILSDEIEYLGKVDIGAITPDGNMRLFTKEYAIEMKSILEQKLHAPPPPHIPPPPPPPHIPPPPNLLQLFHDGPPARGGYRRRNKRSKKQSKKSKKSRRSKKSKKSRKSKTSRRR